MVVTARIIRGLVSVKNDERNSEFPSTLQSLLENKFGPLAREVWSHQTPGSPKFLIMKPIEDIDKISIKDQQNYQSGIDMLLYLTKHSCHDLANATRELSKANDGANPAAYKELLCVIKYILNTKNFGLKIEPTGNSNEPWKIVFFSSS